MLWPVLWLDLNILDRLFQPVANLVGRWVSPFLLAAFIVCGMPFTVLHEFYEAWQAGPGVEGFTLTLGATATLFAQSILMVLVNVAAKVAERHAKSNRQTANPNRMGGIMGMRLATLVIWPFCTLVLLMRSPWFHTEESMLFVSCYLVSVTWRPPMKRQSSRVPLGAFPQSA